MAHQFPNAQADVDALGHQLPNCVLKRRQSILVDFDVGTEGDLNINSPLQHLVKAGKGGPAPIGFGFGREVGLTGHGLVSSLGEARDLSPPCGGLVADGSSRLG